MPKDPGAKPLRLLLFVRVLVGGKLERAVESLLKMALLDGQRPVGDLSHDWASFLASALCSRPSMPRTSLTAS